MPKRSTSNKIIAVWHLRMPNGTVKVGSHVKLTYQAEDVEVEVMAQVGKYLMIRRPGCMPFVATTKEVTLPTQLPSTTVNHRQQP